MKRKKINYQLLLRRVCLIVLDIFLIILSSLMALATRFEFDVRQIPEEFFSVLLDYGVLMIFVDTDCFWSVSYIQQLVGIRRSGGNLQDHWRSCLFFTL